jgi:hypothetical protein
MVHCLPSPGQNYSPDESESYVTNYMKVKILAGLSLSLSCVHSPLSVERSMRDRHPLLRGCSSHKGGMSAFVGIPDAL